MSENNTKPARRIEMDYFRALAVIGLIFVHLVERFVLMEDYSAQHIAFDSVEGIISLVMEYCGIGACLFAFCLGIGLVYSRRKTALYLFKRGCLLFVIALVLSFIRDVLPVITLYLTTGTWVKEAHDILGWQLCSDILMYASLTFLFFSLVYKLKLKNIVVLGIGIVLLLAATVMPVLVTDNYLFQLIFGWFFWQDTGYSFFPVCSWLIFSIGGYLFGQKLKKQENFTVFYGKTLAVCAALLAVLTTVFILCGINPVNFFTLYQASLYHMNIFAAAWITCNIIIWLGALYFIATPLKDRWISKAALSMSRLLTVMYCIQWVIIGWASYIAAYLGLTPTTYLVAFLLVIPVTAASYLLGLLFVWKKQGKVQRTTSAN